MARPAAFAVGLLTAAFLAAAFLASAPTATAREGPDTNIGCDGTTVEAFFPVCVTDPCPGYVCVHTGAADICRTLG